ncbi:MAG TPA: CBS domain-containing protein [Polyangia bacterium]|nr:CBS domain-containing protein [Polyangia bacterium]
MTREVLCVREDLDVDSARALLTERAQGGAPVVNRERKLIGFVSMSDLLGDEANGATVDEVMVRAVVTLPESATLAQAAAVMAFEGLHRIPVLRSDRSVAGIVSAIDVLRHLARAEGYLLPSYTQRQRTQSVRGSRC